MINQAEHRPFIIQADRTLYMPANHPDYAYLSAELQAFAELVKTPSMMHVYRITPLSLWNAVANGWTAGRVINFLEKNSRFPLTQAVREGITADVHKFGKLLLKQQGSKLYLLSLEQELLDTLLGYPSIASFFFGNYQAYAEGWVEIGQACWLIEVNSVKRGELKQEAIRLGYPILDEAGYIEGEALALAWRETLPDGTSLHLRTYQLEAVEAFYREGSFLGGHGTVVLPCGAGKTIVGIGALVKQQVATLILTSNTTSVKQWKQELLEKTTLTEADIAEYSSLEKQIKPITITTYQMLTYRSSAQGEFEHMQLFHEKNWGFIIYDEVHLLPAPVFRATASIQSTRRLGLTATLIREDGREEDVFSLIGPKRYELPWRKLEKEGFIAKAYCLEVQVPFEEMAKEAYLLAPTRQKLRIAQENPHKEQAIHKILAKHQEEPTLIIGQYVEQLENIARTLAIPVISGKTKQNEREHLYHQFRVGQIKQLAVSKVANFAVNLPDATVAIQISGMYGSRQEEAQRLGRILRPKERNEAYFYHIVTKDSIDQEYALKRKLYLIEQGYEYQALPEADL